MQNIIISREYNIDYFISIGKSIEQAMIVYESTILSYLFSGANITVTPFHGRSPWLNK